MGLFNRIHDVFLANAHHAIDRSEDPEVMLKQVIREMDQGIHDARTAVVNAVAGEKQLAHQLERHRRAASDLERKAETALRAGKENLAREALTRKAEHDRVESDLDESWRSAKETCRQLKAQLDTLVARRAEASRRREVLVARQRTAQARSHLTRSLSSVSAADTSAEKFDRLQSRVHEMEAEAAAVTEVMSEGRGPEHDIEEIESAARIEDALAALKSRIQPPDPAA